MRPGEAWYSPGDSLTYIVVSGRMRPGEAWYSPGDSLTYIVVRERMSAGEAWYSPGDCLTYIYCSDGEDESRKDQEKMDLVELLEAVTYLVCQDNPVSPETFHKVNISFI